MSDQMKEPKASSPNSPVTSKSRFKPDSSKSPQQSTSKKESTPAKQSDRQGETQGDDDEAPFEDVDLSDPPPDEPSYELVEQGDAPHSSYNTQPDHEWKYLKDFGKGRGKGGKGT